MRVTDKWGRHCEVYDEVVTKVTHVVAERLVDLIQQHQEIDSSSHILDNGCGTGVLTEAVAKRYPATSVLAIDLSPGMVYSVKSKDLPHVDARVIDAMQLKNHLRTNPEQTKSHEEFSHIVSSFMLQFLSSQLIGCEQMRDMLRPGGTLGIANWRSFKMFEDVWLDACHTIDVDYQLPEAGIAPKAWRSIREIEEDLRSVGFQVLKSEIVTPSLNFASPQAMTEFWFHGGNPPIDRFVAPFRQLPEQKYSQLQQTYLQLVERDWAQKYRYMTVETIVTIAEKM